MRHEVIRSHLALNQQQLNVSAARKRNVESRVRIAVAIGVPVDALSEIDLVFTKLSTPPVLSAPPIQNLKEIALRERPEVLAALADYEAAQSALQLEIANQYPNIQADPGYAWNLGEHRWALGQFWNCRSCITIKASLPQPRPLVFWAFIVHSCMSN